MSIEIEQKIYSDFDKLNIESVCGSQKKSYEELWQAILPYMYSLSGPSIYRELNSLISDAAKFYVRVIFESRLNEIEDDTMKKIAKVILKMKYLSCDKFIKLKLLLMPYYNSIYPNLNKENMLKFLNRRFSKIK